MPSSRECEKNNVTYRKQRSFKLLSPCIFFSSYKLFFFFNSSLLYFRWSKKLFACKVKLNLTKMVIFTELMVSFFDELCVYELRRNELVLQMRTRLSSQSHCFVFTSTVFICGCSISLDLKLTFHHMWQYISSNFLFRVFDKTDQNTEHH